MADTSTKLPVETRESRPAEDVSRLQPWHPFGTLRSEIDRLFDDLGRDWWRLPARRSMFSLEPFWPREGAWNLGPAVDVVEKENAFEVTADLPGMDEKNIEVKLVNGNLTIKAERVEEKQEKKRDYHLRERRSGSFERTLAVPDAVDTDRVEASFKKGVLTVVLPKKAEAVKPEKQIEVKAA